MNKMNKFFDKIMGYVCKIIKDNLFIYKSLEIKHNDK